MANVNEPTWPSATLIAVTKSDSTVYNPPLRQLYIGTTGDVTVETQEGTTIVFKGVPAGAFIGPFFVSKVKAATAAGDIVGFV